MQWYVDEGIIPMIQTCVMQGTEIIDVQNFGPLNHETGEPLTTQSIFRMYSNTKIVTSVAAMMLWEQGHFSLDDPIGKFLPAFSDMQVLNPDAKDLSDTTPATQQIKMRHILSHSAGLSYGFIDPESLIDSTYTSAGVNPLVVDPSLTLESLVDKLGALPLCYNPGSSWRYSLATDVTARIIEVISNQRFDDFLKSNLFEPLQMPDTDFYVPASKLDRFTSMYQPDDLFAPMASGYTLAESPETSAYNAPRAFLSGGGGLVSTLEDYTNFLRMIVAGGTSQRGQILQTETLQLMRQNQLAPDVGVSFPMWAMPDTTFGLGFALKNQPAEGEPVEAIGEYHWGGMAGTHSWMAPELNITGFCLTQRMPGFWHPFSHDFKRLVYQAATK